MVDGPPRDIRNISNKGRALGDDERRRSTRAAPTRNLPHLFAELSEFLWRGQPDPDSA